MYISVSDAAAKFDLSKRRVQILCEQGRISGAKMVSGVWIIPSSAEKPRDGRKKKATGDPEMLSAEEVCEILSVSKATVRNWIRLGKLTPDAGSEGFSREYVDRFLESLKVEQNTKLKTRRNKSAATGSSLYKDYISTSDNRRLAEEILRDGLVRREAELRMVLANFAVQLFCQSRGICCEKQNVLQDFLKDNGPTDFAALIKDLLGGNLPDPDLSIRLEPVLEKQLRFVKGEDSLGFLYISLRDIGQRKRSGIYYTPQKVVNRLVDDLFRNDSRLFGRTFCDPCCGTGNFLLRLVNRGIDPANLYGQDIDPISVYLTRINLSLAAPQLSAAEIRAKVIIGNTYFKTFSRRFDVILGNPPWGSTFSKDEAARCRKLFKTAAGNNLESYDLFLEKALAMLNPNGVAALVLPEAILTVAAHDTVRRLLIDSCSFRFVSYLGNVFSGVQCPSVILGVALDCSGSAVGCQVFTERGSFTIRQARTFVDGTLPFHISDEENECLRVIESVPNAAYLKGNARFALGIVTGNNKEHLCPQWQDGCEIILKGSDIFRYGITPSRNYIRFVPTSFQQAAPEQIYRAKEKLFYRFICEVPVFAYDDQKMLSLNSCNIVIPEIPGLRMKYVLAILNSSAAAFYISRKFRSVKLLRGHIEQMPIPVVSEAVQARIVEKVERIMNACENIRSLYEALDREIMALFGLSADQVETVGNALAGKNTFLRDP